MEPSLYFPVSTSQLYGSKLLFPAGHPIFLVPWSPSQCLVLQLVSSSQSHAGYKVGGTISCSGFLLLVFLQEVNCFPLLTMASIIDETWDSYAIWFSFSSVTMINVVRHISTNLLLCFSVFTKRFRLDYSLACELLLCCCCCCAWMWPIFLHVELSGANMCPTVQERGEGAALIGWQLAGLVQVRAGLDFLPDIYRKQSAQLSLFSSLSHSFSLSLSLSALQLRLHLLYPSTRRSRS